MKKSNIKNCTRKCQNFAWEKTDHRINHSRKTRNKGVKLKFFQLVNISL